MNRPLIFLCIAFIVGILFANITQSYWFIIYSGIVLTVIVLAFGKIKNTYRILLVGIIVSYFVGALYYLYIYNKNTYKFSEYAGKRVYITGYIDSAPDADSSKVVYQLKTEEISIESWSKGATRIKGRILLTVLRSEVEFIDYGRKVMVSGTLNIPKGSTNPSGFSYRTYLSHNGISATLFVRGYNIRLSDENNGNLLVKLGLYLRSRIVYVINESLPHQQAGLLNGMLIGYKQDLTEEVQDAFSDSGLSHIMAVSGSNVAFIVLPLVFLFGKLKVRQNYANVAIIATLILFTLITGFEPSVLRAVIMAATILIGQIIFRETEIFTSISFAALLLLLYNPGILFNIGFQLSFGATISLVLFYKFFKEKLSFKFLPAFIVDVLAATISAQIGVLPITVFYFNKISVVSLISNLLVVPVVEFITILGSLMAIFGQIHIVLSTIIGYVNNVLLSFVLLVTKLSASMPWAVKTVTTPSIILVICYYAAIIYFFWYKPNYKVKLNIKYFILTALLVLGTVVYGALTPKALEVIFLDVGQGDCAFVRTSKGKTILIDGGGYSSENANSTSVGENIVLPFLLDYGVDELDLVIASHGHDDHIQGLKPILQELKVNSLVIPDVTIDEGLESLSRIAEDEDIELQLCAGGDSVKLDEITYFDVLAPNKGAYVEESPLNNNSLVLKLHYKDVSILFTGDIEMDAEKMLISENADLKADVLKIAHHGSPGSTSKEFLQRVNPDVSVISVGKNNFGHPSDTVLQLLESNGIMVFRTDYDGAVVLKTYGKDIKIKRTVKQIR
jgi:competence protein ComEC